MSHSDVSKQREEIYSLRERIKESTKKRDEAIFDAEEDRVTFFEKQIKELNEELVRITDSLISTLFTRLQSEEKHCNCMASLNDNDCPIHDEQEQSVEEVVADIERAQIYFNQRGATNTSKYLGQIATVLSTCNDRLKQAEDAALRAQNEVCDLEKQRLDSDMVSRRDILCEVLAEMDGFRNFTKDLEYNWGHCRARIEGMLSGPKTKYYDTDLKDLMMDAQAMLQTIEPVGDKSDIWRMIDRLCTAIRKEHSHSIRVEAKCQSWLKLTKPLLDWGVGRVGLGLSIWDAVLERVKDYDHQQVRIVELEKSLLMVGIQGMSLEEIRDYTGEILGKHRELEAAKARIKSMEAELAVLRRPNG